jgi:hypothetical protein
LLSAFNLKEGGFCWKGRNIYFCLCTLNFWNKRGTYLNGRGAKRAAG